MRGRRVVLVVAAAIVAVSATLGATVPLLFPDIGSPRLFGLVALPATVPGYAAYGALSAACLLAVGLALVEAVSRRADA